MTAKKKTRIRTKTRTRRAVTRPQPKPIVPSEVELKEVREGLLDHYKLNSTLIPEEFEVEVYVDRIIDFCKAGWAYAPKTFLGRITTKTGWSSTGDLKPRAANLNSEVIQIETPDGLTKEFKVAKENKVQEEIIKLERSKSYPGLSLEELEAFLPDLSERKFWLEREKYYMEEFDFNFSSDYALLQQLLMEELTQRRIIKSRTSNPNDTRGENSANDVYKRMIDAQKALGITRSQREGAMSQSEGNIAQLSVIYNKKKKFLDKIKKEREEHQIRMMDKRRDPDTLNVLPKDLADSMLNYQKEQNIKDGVLKTEDTELDEETKKLLQVKADNISQNDN